MVVDLEIRHISFDIGTLYMPPKSIHNIIIMNCPSAFLQFVISFQKYLAEILKRQAALNFLPQIIQIQFCTIDGGLIFILTSVSIVKGNNTPSYITTMQQWIDLCVCFQVLMKLRQNQLMNCTEI